MRRSTPPSEARHETKEIARKEEKQSLRKEYKPSAAELEIRKLYLSNKKILDSIGHIEKQEHDLLIKKCECVLALAKNFEKLHELRDYEEPIEAIASTIVGLIRDRRGFFASEGWIRDILPMQYKEPLTKFQIPELQPLDYLSFHLEPYGKNRTKDDLREPT